MFDEVLRIATPSHTGFISLFVIIIILFLLFTFILFLLFMFILSLVYACINHVRLFSIAVPAAVPSGMLLATPTLPNIIFWQWINQTYNAIFNSCNAAKGGGTKNDRSTASAPAHSSNPATAGSFLSKEQTELLKGYVYVLLYIIKSLALHDGIYSCIYK